MKTLAWFPEMGGGECAMLMHTKEMTIVRAVSDNRSLKKPPDALRGGASWGSAPAAARNFRHKRKYRRKRNDREETE